MKTNNKKKNQYKSFVFNKKNIGKIIVLIFLIILSIAIYLKIRSNVIEENLNDHIWMEENINVVKNPILGKDIYSVEKEDYVDVYNLDYQEITNSKISKLIENNEGAIAIYNPYGTNISSLNIYLKDAPNSIKYKVTVKDKNDFEKELNPGKNAYELIGLIPGEINNIEITINEEIHKYKVDLTTIKYNSEIELSNKKGKSNKELSGGLFVVFGDKSKKNYVSFYDNEGTLRGEMPITNYRANNIIFRNDRMYMNISESKIAEINNLGQVTEIYSTGKYNLHHDFTFDDSGDFLILATERESITDEDIIIRLDLDTKEIFKLVDFKDLLSDYYKKTSYSASSFHDGNEDGYDWIHINSLSYSEGNIFVSSREASAIIKIENIERTPNIVSIIGNKEIWKDTEYFDLVYTKNGEFTINAGQNDIRYKKTDNKDIYYISMFNNNFGNTPTRKDFNYEDIGIKNTTLEEGDNSYYYVYKVDAANRTYELVKNLELDYSPLSGSAKELGNGNTLISAGDKGIIYEFDPEDNLIMKYIIKSNKNKIYRVDKITFNNFYFKG